LPESVFLPFTFQPTCGILKGGAAYGCEKKSQKESQKEKVSIEMWGCGVVDVNPPYSQAPR
jgi:hypothetical protein